MTDNQNNAAANLLNIESLVNSHDAKLTELQKDLSVQKDMLSGMLESNEEYALAHQEATKTAKVKMLAKQKVLKSPSAVTVVEKVKEIQSEIKELKVALSDYLSQYVSLSGTNQIEGPDGVIRQIVHSAKLVKKVD